MYLGLVLLMPSVLGLKLLKNFNKLKEVVDLIIYYLLLVLFSNYFTILIFYFFISKDNLFDILNNTYIYGIQYITISMVFNLILAILFSIISKYFIFTIEVENGRKNKK